jgi:hypothetical protein
MKIYRDKSLLKLAQGEECLLQVPEICQGGTETIVACHSNLGSDGKGMGQKASDAATVWGCAACHKWLDQGPASQEEKAQVFDDALTLQYIEWIKIARTPSLRPWKVTAAKNVLNHLGLSWTQSATSFFRYCTR